MACNAYYSTDGGVTWAPQSTGLNEVTVDEAPASIHGLMFKNICDGCEGDTLQWCFPPKVIIPEVNYTTEYEKAITFSVGEFINDPFNTSTFTVTNGTYTAANGVVTVNGNDVTYTPNASYNGNDTFSISVANAFCDVEVSINMVVKAQQGLNAVINSVVNVPWAQVNACNSEGFEVQACIDVGNTGVVDYCKNPQSNSGCDFIELNIQGYQFVANLGDRVLVRVSNVGDFKTPANYDEASLIVT